MSRKHTSRRKVLIGIGALAAGGSAALGTGAFTSVEAERSFTVTTTGDGSANLALAPAGGDNAAEYVNTTSGTLGVTLDNVNDEAVTEFDRLFTVQNNGSQPVFVHVEDSSDAVTFRSGSKNIEEARRAVELSVGEQIVVGVTVDTTGGQSGNLLSTATIVADAGGSGAVNAGAAEFDLLVDNSLSSPGTDEFTTISEALSAASENDTIQVVDGSYASSGRLTVDTTGVTLRGPNAGTHGAGSRSAEATLTSGVNIAADDVTFDGFEIDGAQGNGINITQPVSRVQIQNSRIVNVVDTGFPQSGGVDVAANGVNVQLGGSNTGQPADTMAGFTVRDNEISGFDISANGDSSDEVTATGIRLNQKDKNVEDPVISGNVITGLTASNDEAGTVEARGVTVDAATATGADVVTGLTIDSNEISNLSARSTTGVAIFENFNVAPRVGPTDFVIRANDFSGLTSTASSSQVSEVSGAIFVGGYEGLGDDHLVAFNNFSDGDSTTRVARFGQDQGPDKPDGYDASNADALQVENNYWGAADGPSGNQGVGGSGSPAISNDVNNDPINGGLNLIDVTTGQDGFRTNPVSFAGPDK